MVNPSQRSSVMVAAQGEDESSELKAQDLEVIAVLYDQIR